jgi:hypothetical protein
VDMPEDKGDDKPVDETPVDMPEDKGDDKPVDETPVDMPEDKGNTVPKDQKEVPEPTTILASGLALAGGRMLKRRTAKKNAKV